jgi:hypothetical protein
MVISLYAKGANAMGKALIKREGHKIIFQGPIEEDSYERLAAVFVPGIKNVKGSPDPSQLLDDSREKQTILKFNGLDEIEERACGKIVRKLFRDGICAPRIDDYSCAIGNEAHLSSSCIETLNSIESNPGALLIPDRGTSHQVKPYAPK